MAYKEITETKTVELNTDGGTITLPYYAGNKDNTGSITGNADKKQLVYQFDNTVDWITSVNFTNKDATANNIVITYSKNTDTSDRSVNLKLKDQLSAYYLILKQGSNLKEYKLTVTFYLYYGHSWTEGIIISSDIYSITSGTSISQTGLYLIQVPYYVTIQTTTASSKPTSIPSDRPSITLKIRRDPAVVNNQYKLTRQNGNELIS